MRSEKKKYDVFLIGDGHGVYASSKAYKGTTYAVSEKQAISQVRYRTKGIPDGCSLDDAMEGGYIRYHYEAREARV